MSFHMRGVFIIAYWTSLIKHAMIFLDLLKDQHVQFTIFQNKDKKGLFTAQKNSK